MHSGACSCFISYECVCVTSLSCIPDPDFSRKMERNVWGPTHTHQSFSRWRIWKSSVYVVHDWHLNEDRKGEGVRGQTSWTERADMEWHFDMHGYQVTVWYGGKRKSKWGDICYGCGKNRQRKKGLWELKSPEIPPCQREWVTAQPHLPVMCVGNLHGAQTCILVPFL